MKRHFIIFMIVMMLFDNIEIFLTFGNLIA